MRTAGVVVLSLLVALAAGSAIPKAEKHVATNDELVIQKNILALLLRVHQHNLNEEQVAIANSYDIEAHTNDYKNSQVVKNFLAAYKHGDLLHRAEPFSLLYRKHFEEAQLLFDLLYFAKTYDTFYKTACWARERVNEALFVYAVSVAVIHRPDTQNVILPPLYEVLPNLFVESDVIHQAVDAYTKRLTTPVVIHHNYSHHISNPEQKLAYFTEDVGLSSYNSYLNLEYPFWFESEHYGIKTHHRGKIFLYTLQQLLARYQLERLSVGLPGVETFDLDVEEPVHIGYDSHLSFHNGKAVPARPEGIHIHSNDLITVDDLHILYERIRDAIDSHTFVSDEPKRIFLSDVDASEVLGNIIQGNSDSINWRYFKSIYYGILSLYGHIVDPEHHYQVSPSVLENFATQLRDPLYYRIVKKIAELYKTYKDQLPSYTRDQLIANGIKITNVEVDKLYTYDDDYEFDLNAVLEVANKEDASHVDIRLRQQRLNHKPYNYNINVQSEKAGKAIVRVYLGPKYDYLHNEFTLEEKRLYMVELDRFIYDLQVGENKIVRNSRDSSITVPDQITTRILLKKIEDALQGKDKLEIGSAYRHCGFPQRLLIPRGNKYGKTFELYVVVSNYEGKETHLPTAYGYCGVGIENEWTETKSLLYPFDRKINLREFFVPNIYKKDVVIYHKTQEELNKAV